MRKFRFFLCYLLFNIIITGFSIPSYGQILEWDFGRNDYEIPLENVDRHFIVHVPQSYSGTEPVPVVFMFHGTNAQGHSFWLDSKWKELAEVENFIAVFPSSWRYLLTTDGSVKDKWNYSHLYEVVQNPGQLKDDVAFINIILDRIIETFNVDDKRVYASGFSNGSKFVHTRILPEINDRFAAAGCSAGLMFNRFDIQGNLLPTISMIGTKDGKLLPIHPDTILPFNVQEILNDPLLGKVIDSTIYSLQLEKVFTVDSTQQAITFHFNTSVSGKDNEWHFVVLNRVPHVYPHGNNNLWDMTVAPIYWTFFQQFQVLTNVKNEISNPEFPCLNLITVLNKSLDVSCLFRNAPDQWQVFVSNTNGQVLKTYRISDDFLDLQAIRPGIYIITFQNRNEFVHSLKVYLH